MLGLLDKLFAVNSHGTYALRSVSVSLTQNAPLKVINILIRIKFKTWESTTSERVLWKQMLALV